MADFDPYLSWLGIPLSQRPPTAYQLLAIDPAITDPAVIKALALQRAAYVRNFQKGEHGELCSRILEELSQAETTLAEPAKRAAYDRSLKPATPVAAPKPPAPVLARPKPKSAAVPVAAVAVETAPKRRRTRSKSKNSDLLLVVAWVGGGVALLIGVAVLVSVLRSHGDQPTAPIAAALPGTPTSTSTPQSSTPVPQDAQPSTPAPSVVQPTATSAPSSYSSQPAILKISFEVPVYDALISIDGSPRKPTKNGGAYPLSAGEHGVEIVKGNTLRFVTRVTLRAGETHDCLVAMSAFKAWDGGSPPEEPPAKRIVNLPPHDPEEVVVARYYVEKFSIVTLLKGKAEMTHTEGFYELKAPWKEFDDGVEFHVVSNSQGRTVVVDPRIVGRESYTAVVARPVLTELNYARKQNNPNAQVSVRFLVVHKTSSARVVTGKATVVQGGQSWQFQGSVADFEDGIEVEFSSPGFLPLVVRADPEQMGTRSIVLVELLPDKSGKKPSRTKKG